MKTWAKTYLGVFLTFLYAPIFVLILFSFNNSKGRTFTGFTGKWYAQLFSDAAVLDAMFTTLVVAIVAASVATIMGTAAAIGINNMEGRMRSSVMSMTYLPIINPEIIVGVSFMLLFVVAKNILNSVGIPFQFGWITLIVAHITFNVPYVILSVLPKLRQMDASLMDAAMDLGCNHWQAFSKVIIHEIKPGIVSGFLMAITFSVDDFVVSYFTTGAKHQTLSVLIYAMTKKRVSPEINAISTLLFGVVLLVLVIINISERRNLEKRKKARRIAMQEVEGR
ncbi:MAG: ABC transporter permease [Firmicutes bacterium]|nr:ABC transporter permease [Bacillota bacterium]MBR2576171.1 ABC transporter permease [Bacillota bacterium]